MPTRHCANTLARRIAFLDNRSLFFFTSITPAARSRKDLKPLRTILVLGARRKLSDRHMSRPSTSLNIPYSVPQKKVRSNHRLQYIRHLQKMIQRMDSVVSGLSLRDIYSYRKVVAMIEQHRGPQPRVMLVLKMNFGKETVSLRIDAILGRPIDPDQNDVLTALDRQSRRGALGRLHHSKAIRMFRSLVVPAVQRGGLIDESRKNADNHTCFIIPRGV